MPSKKNPYSEYTRNWNAKLCGPKPTEAELATAEALGFRQGSKVAFANAMYIRSVGATGDEVVAAVGKPQLNGRRALVASGLLKKGGEVKDSERNRVVYRSELTARGKKLVAEKLVAAGIVTEEPAPVEELIQGAFENKLNPNELGQLEEAPDQIDGYAISE